MLVMDVGDVGVDGVDGGGWWWMESVQGPKPLVSILPDGCAWSLPVMADRVVLSHPGFKCWIQGMCVELIVKVVHTTHNPCAGMPQP